MVQDQRTELATVKEDIQQIRDALTGHVAKEDVIYEIFKRVMNTGVTITLHRSRSSSRSAAICSSIRSVSTKSRHRPSFSEPPSCGFFHAWREP
jgi:hypothetical protein